MFRTAAIPSPEKDFVFRRISAELEPPHWSVVFDGQLLDTFSTLNHRFEYYFDVIWEIGLQMRGLKKENGGSHIEQNHFLWKIRSW